MAETYEWPVKMGMSPFDEDDRDGGPLLCEDCDGKGYEDDPNEIGRGRRTCMTCGGWGYNRSPFGGYDDGDSDWNLRRG